MPKVLVHNATRAPQGFFEASVSPGEDKAVTATEATYIRPNQTMVLSLPEEHLGDGHIPPGVSVIREFTRADVEARNATVSEHARSAHGVVPAGPADDGQRAAEGANARPAAAVAAGDGPGPVADEFEGMSDDQLRAHITTRDSKAPHHMLGRPKLLAIARGEGDEAVG